MQLCVGGGGQICIRSPCGGRGGEALGSSAGFITSIESIDCDFLCVYTYVYTCSVHVCIRTVCIHTRREK